MAVPTSKSAHGGSEKVSVSGKQQIFQSFVQPTSTSSSSQSVMLPTLVSASLARLYSKRNFSFSTLTFNVLTLAAYQPILQFI